MQSKVAKDQKLVNNHQANQQWKCTEDTTTPLVSTSCFGVKSGEEELRRR